MTLINNILSSGFTFDEGEDLLRFKFRMLNIMLFITVGTMLVFAIMHSMGLNELGDIHARSNYVASSFFSLIFFWLRQSKQHYKRVAMTAICAAIFSFTSALIFVPNDEFRLVWFLLSVLVAHLVVGRGFGLFIVALSIFLTLGSNHYLNLNLSLLTLMSFVMSLLITSFLLICYSEKISSYEAVLLKNNLDLKALVNLDELTKVMSRRYFMDMGNKYFSGSIRSQRPITLLMLDIDYFKRVNDSYGHHVGDQMLMLFAESISKLLRKSDIFGRIGGEEFGILLFETDMEAAQVLAERVRQTVENLHYQSGKERVNMTISIGVGKRTASDDSFEKMMVRADKALYQAKESGRNCISIAEV